jgi:hypothetical protein
MQESTIDRFIVPVPQSQDVMTEILRAGAQKMLADMIQAEVEDWLAERAQVRDEQGRRQVVRNGFLPEREISSSGSDLKHHSSTTNSRTACFVCAHNFLRYRCGSPTAVPTATTARRCRPPRGRRRPLRRAPSGRASWLGW